ncbi:MAG: N-acetyl-gamma-glutamyl-phosphate reductase [Corynebacterium sp.]|nr:N-acetyl-gamma-glutamyl-phosphate reductase [Corynebacterium sp.]
MSKKVAVVGASGYAGSEIIRLLLNHPEYHRGELQIGALTAASSAGTPVPAHLSPLAGRLIEPTEIPRLAQHDVVFICLPHGHSAEIAKAIEAEVAQNGGELPVIIDCAADFRLRNKGDWDAYYGGDYAGSWPYGIPEMPRHRAELIGAKHIAVPGCFPTGATLATMPAVAAGFIIPNLSIVSVTGVSGAGKKPSAPMLGSETMGSVRAYNTAGRHRHNPEIIQNLSEFTDQEISLSFTPVLAPMTRGILTTASAPINGSLSTERAHEVYAEFYDDEPFVQVMPIGTQPETQNVAGSNMVHIQVEVDPRANRLLMISAIDNLTKGTGGAAVQCMNLALGYEETAGLPMVGLAP